MSDENFSLTMNVFKVEELRCNWLPQSKKSESAVRVFCPQGSGHIDEIV